VKLQQIIELDKCDSLARKREEFELPEDKIYLDGNSLGPLTKKSALRVREVIEQQWGQDLISSWNSHRWIDLPCVAGEKIAPLLGAEPGQVICCDSISINLYKLLACALQKQAKSERNIILSQQDNFPTDLYAVEGLAQLTGETSCELMLADETSISSVLTNPGNRIAVLLLTQVNFRTGKLHDIQQLTELAHQHGALVVWDLAHSTGVLPLRLDDWNVDFAVGCGYKYLNGGPGAPAFIYAAKRHLSSINQPLKGWMGHRDPFEFSSRYQAADGITQFLCGTPSIISMSALDAALELYADISVDQVRTKSIALSELFLTLKDEHECLASLVLVSPRRSSLRGSQLAFEHTSAYAICQALAERQVVADFRHPNILRLGFSPLALRYEDIWKSVQALSEVMTQQIYLEDRFKRRARVT